MEEKPQQIKGINSEPRQFEPVAGMNGSGTDSKSDTPLTPTGSGFDLEDTRRDLIAMRTRLGADTPAGHRCSNIIAQMEALKTADSAEQRKAIKDGMRKQIAQLADLAMNAEDRGSHGR